MQSDTYTKSHSVTTVCDSLCVTHYVQLILCDSLLYLESTSMACPSSYNQYPDAFKLSVNATSIQPNHTHTTHLISWQTSRENKPRFHELFSATMNRFENIYIWMWQHFPWSVKNNSNENCQSAASQRMFFLNSRFACVGPQKLQQEQGTLSLIVLWSVLAMIQQSTVYPSTLSQPLIKHLSCRWR